MDDEKLERILKTLAEHQDALDHIMNFVERLMALHEKPRHDTGDDRNGNG